MVPPHPRRHLQPYPHLDKPHTLATPSPHPPQLPHRHDTLHKPHHQHRSRLRRRCHSRLPRRKRNRTLSDRLTRDHRPPCRSEHPHRQTRPTSPHGPRSRSRTRPRSLPQPPRSHGRRITPRAPPIPRSIHLTTPRPVATTVAPPFTKARKPSRATLRTAAYRSRTTTRNHPQSGTRDPLSPSGGFALKALAFKISPTRAQTRAGKTTHQPTNTPRPIHLQRAAAELIAHAPALTPASHIGMICHTLQQSGIDTTRWTGRDIAHQLTTDTQQRGWTWPNHIPQPTAFLRWRLTHIDWAATTPTERNDEHNRTRRAEQLTRHAELRARDERNASEATRTEILRTFRNICTPVADRRVHDSSHPSNRP